MKYGLIVVLILFEAAISAFAQASTTAVEQGQGIQEAIDKAHAGDTIEVQRGTYFENVNVDKKLTLRGIGGPLIDAGESGSAITLSAKGIVLEGFTLSGSSASHAGINITNTSRDNLIDSNTVTENRGDGIDLWATENNSLLGNTLSYNYGNGISLWSCDHVTITKNSITNNNGSGLFGGCENSSVTGNTIKANNGSGMVFLNAFGNRIASNYAGGNKVNGIMLIFGSNNSIAGNIASNNVNSGISVLFSWKNSVIANTAHKNFDGIFLGNSSENNVVAGNAIDSNRLGIQLSGSNNNTLYENDLDRNDYSAFDDSENQWDNGSRENHYSDFDCQSVARNDICDSILIIPGGSSRDRYPLAS